MNTTVVAFVSADAANRLASVDAANVRVVAPGADDPPLDRARAAWVAAAATNSTYLLHDADPLQAVSAAWAGRFDGTGAVGELEIATVDTLTRWRAQSIDLPDYYLVDAPDDLPPTLRHWYFGVLGAEAVHRVVAVDPARSIADHLSNLRSGRWWPPLDRLLDGIEHVVPDLAPLAVGTGGDDDESNSGLLTT